MTEETKGTERAERSGWQAGEKIRGRYAVETELGHGGMGTVYGCLDEVGGVRVAVKALPAALSRDSEGLGKVLEAFPGAYGLRHPNIAGLRALEKDEEGRYFLVVDWVAGENLRAWARRRRGGRGIPPEETIPVLRQVAEALDQAHGAGVEHGDLKPGNVMVSGEGKAKVLDFSMAGQVRTCLGRIGPREWPYLAPEQWRGRRADAKSDQYALGVVAYELLAGHPPFENGELEVMKTAVLREKAASIPGAGRAVMKALRRALAKSPEKRWGSCGEFVEALAGKGGRRNARGKTLLGWVAALAALGAGGWWCWTQQPIRPADLFRPKTRLEVSAGEPPALPGETRPEAAFPEEAERLAAQKAAEEESARLEAERVRAEREEKIRRESEELEETVCRLAPPAKTKAENAEAMGYDRGQGFGEKLDEMKAKLAQGEEAMRGRNFRRAKACFKASLAASGWLEENAPKREEAAAAREEAAAGKKSAAEAMDGAHLGLTAWNKAEKARRAAEADFAAAKFKEATAGWNAAVAAYGESEAAARAAKAEQGLEAARGAKRRGAWAECLAAAESALALAAGNAEAKALKGEAQQKMEEAREAAEEEEAAKGPNKAGETMTITLPGGATMEMAWCPPGRFTMGSPIGEAGRDDDETPHAVTLTKGFWLAKTEVTQAQWKSVMGDNPSWFEGDDLPVESVSWEDCQEFCRRCREAGVDLRLPTEAEWEYACRAGSTGPQEGFSLDESCWHGGNSGNRTHPVGQRRPNAWGLHDMHGNAWEWCADWYQGDLGTGDATDPAGPASGGQRVMRGGSVVNVAKGCRSASRSPSFPGQGNRYLGLRPAGGDLLAAGGQPAAEEEETSSKRGETSKIKINEK